MKIRFIQRRHVLILMSCILLTLWQGCGIKEKKKFFARKGIYVVPIPSEIDRADGDFILKPATRIYLSKKNRELERIGKYLAEKLKRATGYNLQIEDMDTQEKKDGIIMILNEENKKSLGNEIVSQGIAGAGGFGRIEDHRLLTPCQKPVVDAFLVPIDQGGLLFGKDLLVFVVLPGVIGDPLIKGQFEIRVAKIVQIKR